jgi:hypothetical protein
MQLFALWSLLVKTPDNTAQLFGSLTADVPTMFACQPRGRMDDGCVIVPLVCNHVLYKGGAALPLARRSRRENGDALSDPGLAGQKGGRSCPHGVTNRTPTKAIIRSGAASSRARQRSMPPMSRPAGSIAMRCAFGAAAACGKRPRRCTGDAIDCLGGNHYLVPPSQRARPRQDVLAGGPRRVPPATHVEWTGRRSTFAELLGWQLG